MVKSRIMLKKPITGLRDPPYLETDMRGLGLYLWWAFCVSSPVITPKRKRILHE